MNIGYLFKLGRSQTVMRSTLRLSEMQAWLRPATSTIPLTSKRNIHVDLKQKDTPASGSPTENKLKEINFPPFLKWLYGGDFNKSVLAYAEVISFDRYYVLQDQINQIQRFMQDNKESIDSIEERGVVPEELLIKIKSLELTGLLIPREYGGAGLLKSEACRLYQELGQSFTLAELFRINELMCTRAIVLHGSNEQKDKYLENISTGDLWTATCMTEKNAGSDPLGIETEAKLDESGTTYHIKGTKTWVANALRANLFLVFSQCWGKNYLGKSEKNLTAFLVDRNTAGLEISQPYNMSALNGLQVCDVTLDCEIPASALLGEEGEAQKIYQSINHDIKFFMAGAVITRLKKLVDATIKHSLGRRQYGSKLSEFELIKLQIGKCSSYIYALEAMLYLTAGLADVGENPDTEMESAVVKEFAIVASDYVTKHCMRILGAQVNVADSEWGLYVAENQVLQSWQGSSNVSKCFIGISGVLNLIEYKGVDMKKYVNPGFYPFLIIKHNIDVMREVRGYFPKRYKLDEKVHPRLGNIAPQVDQACRRLNILAEIMLKTNGLNLQVNERNLEILADYTIEVYAMVSVLARTSRSYVVGHQHAQLEMDLAIPFLADSKARVDHMFNEFLEMSKYRGFADFFYLNSGEYILNEGKYCPVHPLTKNSF